MKKHTGLVKGMLCAAAIASVTYPSVVVKADVILQTTVSVPQTKNAEDSTVLDKYNSAVEDFNGWLEAFWGWYGKPYAGAQNDSGFIQYSGMYEDALSKHADDVADKYDRLMNIYKNVTGTYEEVEKAFNSVSGIYNTLSDQEKENSDYSDIKNSYEEAKNASAEISKPVSPAAFDYSMCLTDFNNSDDQLIQVIRSYNTQTYPDYTGAVEANTKTSKELEEKYELALESLGNIEAVKYEFDASYKALLNQYNLLSDEEKSLFAGSHAKAIEAYNSGIEEYGNILSFSAPDLYYFNNAKSEFDNLYINLSKKIEDYISEENDEMPFLRAALLGDVKEYDSVYADIRAAYSEIQNSYADLLKKYNTLCDRYDEVDKDRKAECTNDFKEKYEKILVEVDKIKLPVKLNFAQKVSVDKSGNVPAVGMNTDILQVYRSIDLTDEELDLIKDGLSVDIGLKEGQVKPSANDEKLIKDALNGYTVGQYIDLTMTLKLGDYVRGVTDTREPVSISVKVPDSMLDSDSSKGRTYKIIRVHNNKASVIDGVFDASTGEFTFETDGFSTYALVYKDAVVTKTQTNEQKASPKTGDTQTAGLYMGILALSGLTMMGLGLAGRKRKISKDVDAE